MTHHMSQQLPYPGLRSFQDEAHDRLLFKGREQEHEALLNLVLSGTISLLYARSGVGKSSLINASLLESLRQKGFWPIVARITAHPGGPSASVWECVRSAAAGRGITVGEFGAGRTLWALFHELQSLMGDDQSLRPVLILDQFEELFTVVQHAEVDAFAEQLADIVRQRLPKSMLSATMAEIDRLSELQSRAKRGEATYGPEQEAQRETAVSLVYRPAGPDVKVLIAIREDFLPELDAIKTHLPELWRHRMRLLPLTVEGARQAIEQPALEKEVLGDGTFTFTSDAVRAIVDFLRRQRTGTPGESIEPAQLQVVLSQLNSRRLRRDRNVVTLKDVKSHGGPGRILREHYGIVLRRIPRLRLGWNRRRFRLSFTNFLFINRPRAAARNLCEKGLITGGQFRNSVMVEEIHRRFGLGDHDLGRLVDARLLRAEPRLHSTFYELTHDTWVKAVHARRVRTQVTRLGVGGLVVTLVFLGQLTTRVAADRAESRRVTGLLATLADSQLPERQRVDAMRELVSARHRDFSGTMLLRGLNLQTVSLSAANLSGADLSQTTLSQGMLAYARLHNAVLRDADLSDANLVWADLKGADLTGANLGGATLRRADLRGARLHAAVLNGANLEHAKVQRAEFDSASLEGVAWWLAEEWGAARRTKLASIWTVDRYAKTDEYRSGVMAYTDMLSRARRPADSVELRNSRAWYRAVRGTELGAAQADADAALTLSDTNAHALDTRGYIFLELGSTAQALRDFKHSVQLDTVFRKDQYPGERLYHLALAYAFAGDTAAAITNFGKSAALGYVPTYECLLTPVGHALPQQGSGCR